MPLPIYGRNAARFFARTARRLRMTVSLALIFVVLVPNAAWSCSVCFLAKKENLMAYFGTGVLLSVLPFLLIGGGVWRLYQRMKERPESLVGKDSRVAEERILVEKGKA
jgi:uncharacterized membrane protein